MLEKHNFLAVNQINAQIKITEMWKAVMDEDHPFKLKNVNDEDNKRPTKANAKGNIKLHRPTSLTERSFIND